MSNNHKKLEFFNFTDETCPNLDGFVAPETLYAFQDECLHIEQALAELRVYARHKASAMKCRLAGLINEAQSQEKDCEIIYKQLPDWARW